MSRLDAELIAALAAACIACGAPPTAPPATPPPVITRAHGDEQSLAAVTLTPEAEARLGLTVARAERRVMRQVRRLPGEIVARPGGTVMLTAPVAGLVLAPGEIPRPGALVSQSQPLARLVPLAAVDRDLRAQAQSRVAAAEARLVAGNSRVQRAERLIETGAGSERAAEDARVERDVAAAELAAATARLRMIDRAPLASDVATTLRAPMAAIVRQVLVAEEQAVAGGTPLLELVTTDPPWVRVPAGAAELGIVDETSAEVTPLAGRAAPVTATRVAGPPLADPLAGTVDLYFALSAAGEFRLGERVGVALATRREAESLVVPRSAIVHDLHGGAWVYVPLGEHRYDRRRVELSQVTGDLALVARGLAAGDEVVVAGAVELYGSEFGAGH
ncbi:efflux RND transporter periplasmic adaptor subunit [Nannocystis radixulma]|uniref:Efflux RND transporter periplasmic adaptor subunit n=1 Tax=Nannocystis radixulma TaxID=2995305 RepID=A0ABT5B8P1_9BACT|nr:efflux RND transporter periplasmic adaptor subunit [Nannocystis radixulma]MDC0669442.1 efflux RND transporter periplasmic adaptor subunit [Nannocystis radixulma]